MVTKIKRYLTPNEQITSYEKTVALVLWLGIGWMGWEAFKSPIFPSFLDILGAFPKLWNQSGLGDALLTSSLTSIEALLLSIGISLPIAYLQRVPASEPISKILSKLRFLSPGVFFLVLLFISPSPHMIKVLMLAAGESFFFITSVGSLIESIPQSCYDDARTLRMNEWEVLWYVVIRGTISDVLETARQIEAMAWPMLTMVEGLVRSEGGVGVLLFNQEKYMNFAALYAIALSILIVGALKDVAISQIRISLCPWSELRR